MMDVAGFHVDLIDTRIRRTGLAPSQQSVHGIIIPLRVKGHRAIRTVPHPTGNSESDSRLLHGISEANTLNTPTHTTCDGDQLDFCGMFSIHSAGLQP